MFRNFDVGFFHFVRQDGVKKKSMRSLLCYYRSLCVFFIKI